MTPFPLAKAFESARKGASASPDVLEASLAAAVDTACANLPRDWVPAEEFCAFLGERLPDPARIADAPLADLYLACATLRGIKEAANAFERLQGSAIDAALRRLDLPPDRIDDLRGTLRTRLLLPAENGRAPLLARYRGAGALGSWLRVVATREGLTSLRGRDGAAASGEEHLASLEDDLELSYVKESCRTAFKAAFGEAVRSLPARERTLMKQHYIDGLSARDIARMRRVHHGTVARWLEDIREAVFTRTRTALRETLNVDGGEFESMIRMLQSRWDVTVARLLDPGKESR